jgi:hypothetical protein
VARSSAKCKTCNHQDRKWLDGQLRDGVNPNRLAVALNKRWPDDQLSARNIYNHVNGKHVYGMTADPQERSEEAQQLVDDVIQDLESEMKLAPPAIRAGYIVLIESLRNSHEWSVTNPETALKALKTITEATGMRTQNHLLLAMVERMQFSPTPPIKAELVRSDG